MAAGVYQHSINKYVLVARSYLFIATVPAVYIVRGEIYGFTICHRRFKFQKLRPYCPTLFEPGARKHRIALAIADVIRDANVYGPSHIHGCSDVISTRYSQREASKGRRQIHR